MGDAEPWASCCEPLSPDQTHARAALPGPRCSGLNVWSGEAAVHASTVPHPLLAATGPPPHTAVAYPGPWGC